MVTQEVVPRFLLNFVLALAAIILATPAGAVDIPVLNTNDSGADSFRAAIEASNLSKGVMDNIYFAIEGPPPHLIVLESNLPVISDPVLIDGYEMQADAHPNTLEEGSDAVLTVGISGELVSQSGVAQGLNITAGGTTVRGLVVVNFDDTGIGMQEGGNNVIAGNYVGVGFDGVTAAVSDDGIIVVSDGNVIGGSAPEDRNVISGKQRGVWLVGDNNDVIGNHVGLSADGSMVVISPFGLDAGIQVGWEFGPANGTIIGGAGEGNRVGGADIGILVVDDDSATISGNIIGPGGGLGNGIGIAIDLGTTASIIGGFAAGTGNVIAHSLYQGIVIGGESTVGNSIRRNSIHHNGRLGIDLQTGSPNRYGGVTENDEDDPDTNGANAFQNFPILTDAIRTETEIQVSVTFNSLPNQNFVLEFFSNTVREPLDGLRHNHGEGEIYLGDHAVMTDSGGDAAPFNVSLPLADGWCISATATHIETGDTSEFSPCFPIIGTECDVTSNAPSGPDTLPAGLAACANSPENGTLNVVNMIAEGPYSLESPLPVIEGPILLKGNGQDVGSTEGMMLTLGFGRLVFAEDINFHGPPGIPGGPGVAFFDDDSQVVGGTHDGNPVFLSGPTGEVNRIVIQDGVLLSLGPTAWEHAGNGSSAIRMTTDGSMLMQGDNNEVIDSIIDASGTPPGSEDGAASEGPGGPFGVLVIAGTGNSSERTVYTNTTVPFDLAPPGNNPNDSGDGDEGPNMLNNTPELVTAPPRAPEGAPGAMATRVHGTLDSTPETTFTIEVFVNNSGCSAGAFGAANVFLGAFDVQTNADGIANFDETLNAETSSGDFILATATDPWGNTSEFSACALAEQVVPALLKDGFED